ncbi:extracellular solute-binding protein [Paenibacillus radicis (ex Gao et al. 2016)]|uniref:ABC transporter substrate-binding protein n=1 Tax=Paenibacillus radicis (ex Gao et al. 2016) TaxID=1737354 RepID=A0A917HM59_9BACL|nr:extracellular solute-binding protein [Paenibacillus radicis (ex Gao et al. 2016)]GGG83609.1 ABC transporter substrate-binding protein [Paenibacillus radicis (ex Gao et al. 2016)]
MNRWRKSAFLVLALMLVAVAALAGCSSSNEGKGNNGNSNSSPSPSTTTDSGGETAAAGFELGSEPLSFSFYGHYDWYTMPPWGGDEATKWIKENKKIDITPVQSGGNAAQKLNTMIASGKLPDVIWLDRGADVERLRAADMLVPFDEYLDKYPNFKKWVGEEAINMLRSSDGKIYQFPNWYTSQPIGNSGYLVNKKIYESLGSPAIETTDDFYNYLKQVKEKYPNVTPFNPDLAIDGQGLDVLFGGFANDYTPAYVANRAVPQGDKLTSLFVDPVFRESMQYASKLFREKLMSQDALTQTKDQVKEQAYNGTAAVFAGASPTEYGAVGDAELKKKDPNDGYIMIWPVHKEGVDKNKVWTGTYTQLGWNVSVITKSAKDPEKIFAFLDYLTGPEGTRTLFWGPEGKYWNGHDEDGAPIFTEAYDTDVEGRTKMMDATVNFQWNGNSVFIDKSKMKHELTLPVEKQSWEARWQNEITWKTQDNATQFINMAPAPDSPEGIIASSFEEIYKEARAKALYAKSDEEVLSILDKAEKDAQAVGYDKLLAYKTAKWQENLKSMQGN